MSKIFVYDIVEILLCVIDAVDWDGELMID